jgi:hypothetical protein
MTRSASTVPGIGTSINVLLVIGSILWLAGIRCLLSGAYLQV